MDWSGGINSNITPTIQSAENPNGLRRNQLAWGNNLTVRGNGISPRRGWQRLLVVPFTALFQEASMYTPTGTAPAGFPYIIAQIGGRTFRVRVDTALNTVDEITVAGDPNSALIDQSWMCQAEQFLVIQDGTAVPLVYNGAILQRVTSMGNLSPKIPTAEAMDYYMGRLWLAKGREYVASDIVGGPSGTAPYKFADSVLSMVENTYLSLGGTFIVPDVAGNIRALKHPVSLDTARGEGKLFVFTRERIYSVNVVPTRAEWKLLTEPIQRVAQINFGTTSDRSVVAVNSDLLCQATDGVRAVIEAIRYFDQWGNTAISVEENRAIDLNNRELLRFGSGILFDNRILQTCLPQQTEVGVIHKGLLPLNFDVISTLAQKLPPAWEGINEGLDILRVLEADFGGRQRAFAFVRSELGEIELWELTAQAIDDTNRTGDARITWSFETPSFTWGKPFQLKQLDTIELWVDKLFGTVDFLVEFRPDQHPCWEYWVKWQICAPRNNCELENVLLPCPYPTQIFRQQYRATMVLPTPPSTCEIANARPISFGYGFQFRITVHGFCRIRGLLVHALPRMKPPFERLICGDQDPGNAPIVMRTIGQPAPSGF